MRRSNPPRELTHQHLAYLDEIRTPKDAASCTLDRTPRGMAVMPERTYFGAMETTYAQDPAHYKLIEDEQEKREALRELRAAELKYRPTNIPV